jgi:hypothetical protein
MFTDEQWEDAQIVADGLQEGERTQIGKSAHANWMPYAL